MASRKHELPMVSPPRCWGYPPSIPLNLIHPIEYYTKSSEIPLKSHELPNSCSAIPGYTRLYQAVPGYTRHPQKISFHLDLQGRPGRLGLPGALAQHLWDGASPRGSQRWLRCSSIPIGTQLWRIAPSTLVFWVKHLVANSDCKHPECCTALFRLFIWRSMFVLRAQGCNKMEIHSMQVPTKSMPEYCLGDASGK